MFREKELKEYVNETPEEDDGDDANKATVDFEELKKINLDIVA